MSTKIFLDVHGLLVQRYELQPSLHMSTYESLGTFLFICGGNELDKSGQNRFRHSGETICRKIEKVLNSFMAMEKDFIRPKSPNFPTVQIK